MVPRLWVPLTQRWRVRNWKRASSGWARTASRVANSASTFDAVAAEVAVSVTDMVVPLGRVVRQAAAAAVPAGAGK